MKLSLFEIVYDILNDMDGDEINSIDDTFESQQIAQIVKSTYFAMVSNRNWPHLRRTIQLEASTNPARPTHMKVDEDVTELLYINYDTRRVDQTNKNYQKMIWLENEDFLRVLNGRRSDNANIDTVIDTTGIELFIVNDTAPRYYTSFDDQTIIFDAYDKEVDTTLQSSKIQAEGYVMPVWNTDDDFIPDLPADAFIALQEEAKSRAQLKLRQIADQKAETEARRQQRWLSRKGWTVDGGIKFPNYGRRGRGYHKEPTFRGGN